MEENKESGMMVVEATLSFTIFIIVCLAVVELINIFTVHNKIQFAIDNAAKQIASYSYIYEAVGLRAASDAIYSDGSVVTGKINEATDTTVEAVQQVAETLNSIQTLASDGQSTLSAGASLQNGIDLSTLEQIKNSISTVASDAETVKNNAQQAATTVKSSASQLKGLLENPKQTFAGIVYLALEAADYAVKRVAGSVLAEVLTEQYLENGTQDADAYLTSYLIVDGYDGLDFSGSSFMYEESRMIDVVVEYDMDLSFLGLILPRDSQTLHVVQRACVAGWVGDDVEVPDSLK